MDTINTQILHYQNLLENIEGIDDESYRLTKQALDELRTIAQKSRGSDKSQIDRLIKEKLCDIVKEYETLNEKYKFINALRYLDKIIESKEYTLDEVVMQIISLLNTLSNSKLNIEERYLDLLYELAYVLMKQELIYSKTRDSKILEIILSNPFHKEYLYSFVKKDIDQLLSNTSINPILLKNLETTLFKVKNDGIESSIVCEELIKALVICTNYEDMKDIHLQALRGSSETVEKLKKQIFSGNTNTATYAFERKAEFKLLEKQASARLKEKLVVILLSMSISIGSCNCMVNNTTYPTSTKTYTESTGETLEEKSLDTRIEGLKKVINGIDYNFTRTMEVLGPLHELQGELLRDYTLYDISELEARDSIEEFKYLDLSELEDKIIKTGEKALLFQDEIISNNDIIITEIKQNLANPKIEEISLLDILPIVFFFITLILLLNLMGFISDLKEFKKENIKEVIKVYKLVEVYSELITKLQSECAKLKEYLKDAEIIVKNEPSLKEEMERADELIRECESQVLTLRTNELSVREYLKKYNLE